VEYIGHVDQRTMATALAAAGFLLYPTSYSETGCVAVMKAMAMGAIPITSRNPHSVLPELTREFDLGPPARDGHDIETDDEWLIEWADAVAAAVRNGSALAGHRRAMVAWARRTMTWDHIAAMWAAEFDDALGGGAAAAA
jgi:protein O-GlcNAc transferase